MNPWTVVINGCFASRCFPTLMASLGYCKCMQSPALIFHRAKPVAEYSPGPQGGDVVMYV